jgi:hypothetical protein
LSPAAAAGTASSFSPNAALIERITWSIGVPSCVPLVK